MNHLLYNSDHYSVLAYPAQQGLELFDKESMSLLFLQGPQAWHFRRAIEEIPEEERNEETIDAFLDAYCAGSTRPIVFH